MMVLAPGNNYKYRRLMREEPWDWGFLMHPNRYTNTSLLSQAVVWAMDNGCFSGFEPEKFEYQLDRLLPFQERCLFVVVPDSVGDHKTTMALWDGWVDRVIGAGYPAAFVGQDGCVDADVPWDELSCFFVGGTDEFKDRQSAGLIRSAQSRGKWVHVGRVNDSPRRMTYCLEMGVDSIDGTSFGRKPDYMLDWYNRFVATYKAQRRLF